MQTQLINFTIPKKLLQQVDLLAKKDLRSRSELLREAVRRFLKEEKQRKENFKMIQETARRINLPEDEAMKLAEEAKKWARKSESHLGC